MELTVKAYPKINIGLYIGNKRPDGFHELVSIFQKVKTVYDTISVRYKEEERSYISVLGIKLDCPEDTMTKASRLWLEKTGRCAGIDISIEKKIPTKSGLGGGSSDAAAVLMALEEITGNKLSFSELLNIGLEVGSDVPFFLYNCQTALVGGRGEIVVPIEERKLKFSLCNTGFEKLSTKDAYEKLDLVKRRENLPDFESLKAMYNKKVSEWEFENDFSLLYPALEKDKYLSGSGSWSFSVCEVD